MDHVRDFLKCLVLASVGISMAACASQPPANNPDAGTTDVLVQDIQSNDSADVSMEDSSLIDTNDQDSTVDAGPIDAGLVGERPYMRRVPVNLDPSVPLPLLVLLHGYGASGSLEEIYMQFSRIVSTRRFLYAYPDGTMDTSGRRFWNASTACCNFGGAMVDDVAYINAVIDDMIARYNVDPRRIYVVGHSNGGFMAYRLACESGSRIAAIVSLAGANINSTIECATGQHVSVLQIHGTADDTILYNGGSINGFGYPSAMDTVSFWGTHNSCGMITTLGTTLDLETTLMGNETTVQQFQSCMRGDVQLWTIQDGSHIPSLSPNWATTIFDFLQAHPRP